MGQSSSIPSHPDSDSTTSTSAMESSASTSVTSASSKNHSHPSSVFLLPHNPGLSLILRPETAAFILTLPSVRTLIGQYLRTQTFLSKSSHNHNLSPSECSDSEEDEFSDSEENAQLITSYLHCFFPHLSSKSKSIPRDRGLDRNSFFRYILPPHVLPPPGVLECLFSGFSSPKTNRLYAADIIIIAGILHPPGREKKYALAWRVYDGYAKKGSVTKETLDKFTGALFGGPTAAVTTSDGPWSQSEFVREFGKDEVWIGWLESVCRAFVMPKEGRFGGGGAKKTGKPRSIASLCRRFGVNKVGLFEAKRKFHGLLQQQQQQSLVVAEEKSSLGLSRDTFISLLSLENLIFSDVLAKRLFLLGNSSGILKGKKNWEFHQVLEFSCKCVRGTKEEIWDLVWQVFCDGKEFMGRVEIGRMLLLLVDHWRCRKEKDKHHIDKDRVEGCNEDHDENVNDHDEKNDDKNDDDDNKKVQEKITQHNESDSESEPSWDESKHMIPTRAAVELGIFPKPSTTNDYSTPPTLPLSLLIDTLLLKHTTQQHLTLQQFHTLISSHPAMFSQFLLELQILSSVIFGICPSQPRLEYDIIKELLRRHSMEQELENSKDKSGKEGCVWYIVSMIWWRKWVDYAKWGIGVETKTKPTGKAHEGSAGNHKSLNKTKQPTNNETTTPLNYVEPSFIAPSEIDNNSLLIQGSLVLRPDLKQLVDFELIPPLVWQALQAWHDGGPPIYRKVIQTSSTRKPEIELYPLFLTLSLADPHTGSPRPFQQRAPVSRILLVSVIIENLKTLLGETGEARLWKLSSKTKEEDILLDIHKSLLDQCPDIKNDDILLMEWKRKADGMWPRSFSSMRLKQEGPPPSVPLGDGIVGLHNMGNTCYLNSSIQCLSHTPLFRQYFTEKQYLRDINPTNPLGYKGRLAQACATLIRKLWETPPLHNGNTVNGGKYPLRTPSLTPKLFKDAISKMNDHFAGNEQHDAQELLAYLLSGLSEDLNRVRDKPYIEQPDSDGRPDSELADIWWKNHLMREKSIIVALFTGQYKSLLVCSECGYESARFEPFGFLQLPLPEEDWSSWHLMYFPISGNITKYGVRVGQMGTVSDILKQFANVLAEDKKEGSEDPEKIARDLAVADVRESRIWSITPPNRELSKIQIRDTGDVPLLYVYELDPFEVTDENDSLEKEETSNDGDNNEDTDNTHEKEEKDKDEQGLQTTSSEPPILPQSRPSYIAIAQRKFDYLSNRAYLVPFAMTAFHTPLLLRIVDLEGFTGSDLYDLLAVRIRPYAPPSAQKHHSNLVTDTVISDTVSSDAVSSDTVSSDTVNSENDDDEGKDEISSETIPPKTTRRNNRQKTFLYSESTYAGQVPRHGFRLRLSSRDGHRCPLCSWYECCLGCLVPDDDRPTIIQDGDTVALDWHTSLSISSEEHESNSFSSQQPNANNVWTDFLNKTPKHSSCNTASSGNSVSLEECLDNFARKEELPEAFCSKCKEFRHQTKRMSLWRVPPVCVIQLKRFQFTQHMRRKLRNLVKFPVEGLDLSRITASKQSFKEEKKQAINEEANLVTGEEEEEDLGSSPSNQTDQEILNGEARSVSSSSALSDSNYDLYGVVHHQGALTGGHYVASLKSDIDGKWRLFNDAQIYEISEKEIVDCSAYILFYVRKDVKEAELKDFWDISRRLEDMEGSEGQDVMTEEQVERMVKARDSRCVVS